MRGIVGVGLLFALPCALMLGQVAGCVGDDPVTSADSGGGVLADGATTLPDSSAADTSIPDTSVPDTSSADASDARVPTCAGQPFGAPVKLDVSQIAATIGATLWGPRVAGANAVFSAVPAGSNEQQIFRATYTPGAPGMPPALSNAAVLAPPSSTSVVEWAPTIAADNSFLVLVVGFPLPRNLALSVSTGGGAFGAATPIAALNTATDETDPYLVGRPAKALYFGRESATGAMEIHRSAVTGGASPQFAAPIRASLACPMANCGTPVVPTNEGMLLFGTWAAGGFDPTVREAVLSVGGGAVSTSGIVDHPELGAHYPSWISDDGCEVLLGGGGVSQVADVAYARRAPK
ncbi:MAG: hypothetical protein U0183_29060 [Polyangiaceae bacterium]